ncbi:AAA family ATPase [Bradyrhizobium sp. SZCCHNR2032]|uniref:AAA family ATPase n=1 Tax=Bradyrhizobium sp. SZCCHNR2032 TaxID=3057384 RepID=UPI00291707FC|nr:AAA family ATPase [Bradyrhizobium sp. SZCCHNR2032]
MADSTNKFAVPTAAASGHAHLRDGRPDKVEIDVSPGTSTVVVGANGSGKTRLGSLIEGRLDTKAHRIGAQRSIRMSANVTLRDFDSSLKELHFGNQVGSNRRIHKWRNTPDTAFVDDFEALLRALFAQQNRTLTDDHKQRKAGTVTQPPNTKIDDLSKIWKAVLPHRTLIFNDASISVQPPPNPPGTGGDEAYSPENLSDGERVVFYLIGQCLLAPENSVVIVDEPELHIHPSITDMLWDALERERSDCAFIYLTHDLEFAANRVTAKKFYLKATHYGGFWDIQEIPEDTGLPEQIVLELAGNRKPVLFVEGDRGSLDSLIYRSAYGDLKVEPIGSCDSVIHAVASFRSNPTMHRWGAVFGCVDADQRTPDQIANLQQGGVWPLAVAEIENVFLVPSVFTALAKALSFDEAITTAKLAQVKGKIFARAAQENAATTARYVARQVDRRLKRVTIDRRDPAQLVTTFSTEIASIDVPTLISDFERDFQQAIDAQDVDKMLGMFDQKGLIDIAARELGLASSKALVQQAARFMNDGSHAQLRSAVLAVLPTLPIATGA